MKTGLLTLIVFNALCAAAFCAQPDPPGFTPVPKEKLDGLRLLLKDHNCSISATSSDRKWLAKSTGTNYMCYNMISGAGYAVSVGDLVSGITDHVKEEVTEGAKKNAAATGLVMSDEKWEDSAIPIPKKSWRFSYLVTFKNGSKITVIMYLVETSDKTLVTLQDSSVTGVDSPSFKTFVSSLKVAK
jgi:hypothetical protein